MCSDLKVPCSNTTLSKCKKEQARNPNLAENPSTAKIGRNSREIISLHWWEGTYVYMLSHYFLFSFILLKNLIQSNLHVGSPIPVPSKMTKHLMEKNFEKCGNIVIKKLNKLNWEQRNMKQAFLTFNDKFAFIKLNSILFFIFFGLSVLSFSVYSKYQTVMHKRSVEFIP